MHILRLLIFLTLPHCLVQAQVINIVENEWDADVNVFFTSLEWNADGIVYYTKSLHHARNVEGHWFIINSGERRRLDCINVYVVDKAGDADLKIYLSKDPSKIRLNQRYKSGAWKTKKPRSEKNEALVPRAGIEPALPKELDFESSASTNSAT